MVTWDQVKSRYDWKALRKKEIYPQAWREGDEDYILDYFEKLKKLYQSAAGRGMGVIQWLN